MNANPVNSVDFSAFAASRRSTRDFLPTPVDPQIIEDIIADGLTSPSWSNTRPIMVSIATGEVRDQISNDMLKQWDDVSAFRIGGLWGKLKFAFKPSSWPLSDYNMAKPYPKALQPRAFRVGKELYSLLGVPRGDKKARDDQWKNNYRFFGAPTVIFVFIHKDLHVFAANDAGMFAQNLMLSAHAKGLGACAQGAVALWPKTVKKHFDIPEDYNLLYGIAIGYRTDSPVNSFGAHRLTPAEITAPVKNK